MRRLYKHADAYLRAVNAMCEASKLLADDFGEVRKREGSDQKGGV